MSWRGRTPSSYHGALSPSRGEAVRQMSGGQGEGKGHYLALLGLPSLFSLFHLALVNVSGEVTQTRNAFRVTLRQALAIVKLAKPEDQLQVLNECTEQDMAGKAH